MFEMSKSKTSVLASMIEYPSKESFAHLSFETYDTLTPPRRVSVQLNNCISCASLQQPPSHHEERQIFARFLSPFSEEQLRAAGEAMVKFYAHLVAQNGEILDIADISADESDQQGRMLGHFVSIWLLHMGYQSERIRKYVLGRLKLLLGDKPLHQYAKMYDDLHFEGMGLAQKRQFLLLVCRNGWETLIQQLIKQGELNTKSRAGVRLGRGHRRYFSHQQETH